MLRLLFFALVLGIIGMIGYNFFRPSAVMAKFATPEEQFSAIVRSGSTTAEELGSLCENYPQLAAKYLRDRPLKITGTVQRFFCLRPRRAKGSGRNSSPTSAANPRRV